MTGFKLLPTLFMSALVASGAQAQTLVLAGPEREFTSPDPSMVRADAARPPEPVATDAPLQPASNPTPAASSDPATERTRMGDPSPRNSHELPRADRIVDRAGTDLSRALGSRSHEHDGIYVRLALGFGGITDGVQSDFGDGAGRDAGVNTAIASASEIAIGGTVGRGLVLGGGLYGSTAFASSYARADGAGLPSSLRHPRSFMLLGPFGDWYFTPTRGFHAQAAVGLATLSGWSWEQAHLSDRRIAAGAGVMLGVGHEWWVSEQWGLGLSARLVAAALGERHGEQTWLHAVATFPSLLLTGTYN